MLIWTCHFLCRRRGSLATLLITSPRPGESGPRTVGDSISYRWLKNITPAGWFFSIFFAAFVYPLAVFFFRQGLDLVTLSRSHTYFFRRCHTATNITTPCFNVSGIVFALVSFPCYVLCRVWFLCFHCHFISSVPPRMVTSLWCTRTT